MPCYPSKTRYREKVEICGLDPYTLKPSDYVEDLARLPAIEYPDIVNYLVLQTSWATNAQMKAYKSLDAYNFFVSGWVGSLLTKEVKEDRILVHGRWPYLGASPDGIVNCDCRGKGCCEIKCPFCFKNATTEQLAGEKSSCLTVIDVKISLDHKHAYYYQVQAQIFITETDYCDFVVWTEQDIHIERVFPDEAFWDEAREKASKFFLVGILPELLGKWYSRPARLNVPEMDDSDGETGPWCYCREDIEGSLLIGCDNDECKILHQRYLGNGNRILSKFFFAKYLKKLMRSRKAVDIIINFKLLQKVLE
ncbi:uncharacterized protein LOC110248026 [Exaiptasia diaphana]|uniref:YqaJ viral recombinase domain-containing protein n=1 Tax=Exaiptasia diaphana TaxID=2652724 RepID=A0A913YRI0_EXADI|nr:uncharacterized protein LOC110248026 [Exaiptasia diaphana]